MIVRDCTILLKSDSATLSETLVLYKGDQNIEYTFTLKDNAYKFSNGTDGNIVTQLEASYAQILWYKNAEIRITFPIQATNDGKVVLKITKELIDEDNEMGDYDFQIRLYDSNKEAILTLPPLLKAVHIKAPLFEKDPLVDLASADVSTLVTAGPEETIYGTDGNYLKTTWVPGMIITSAKLNKIETALYDACCTKTAGDISLTDTSGNFTSDNVEGALSEINSQIKDKANKSTTDNIQQQVNNLVLGAVGDGNNAEVVQARGSYSLLNDRLEDYDNSITNIKKNVDVKYRLIFNLGNLSYGKPVSSSKRIYTNVYYSTSEIELEFDYSKYRVIIAYYSDLTGETELSETAWKSEKIVIEKGVYFRLLFSSGVDNSSESVIKDPYDNDIYNSLKIKDSEIYTTIKLLNDVQKNIETTTDTKLNEVFVTISSKNLIDEAKLSNVAISDTNGTELPWTTYHTSDYIPVIADKYYKFSENEGQNTGCQYIAYYDNDKKFYIGAKSLSVLNPTKDGYIRLSRFTNGSMEGKRWQLEEVTSDNQSATFYVPYHVEKTVKAIPSSIKSELIKQGRLLSKNKYDSSLKSFIRVTIHRGKTSTAPENTIPAFEQALIDGYNSIETDVQFTSDNVPVLLHDDTIDRTSSGTGTLTSMTYADVSKHDFGSWKSSEYTGTKIPTLDDFIFFCKKNGVHPYVEIKNSGLTSAQADIIINICKKYNMLEYITFISFYKNNLFLLLERESNLRIGILTNANNVTNDLEIIKSLENGICDLFLDVNGTNITEDYFNIINSNGYNIEGWTYSTIPEESILKMLDGYTIDL